MKMLYFVQPGKRKAKKMVHMWVVGCNARNLTCMTDSNLRDIRKNYVSVFYGVAPSTLRVFNQAMHAEKPFLYIDNCYFPALSGTRNYRVTWNALQHHGTGKSDGKRLLRVFSGNSPTLQKWSFNGRHILITLQSELYFNLLLPYTRQAWLERVVETLRKHTDRPIIVREKPHSSRPVAQQASFEEQLRGCYAVVTLNSATAIEGIMRGIPAFVTDPNCAIVPAAHTALSKIENPEEFDRMPWLEVLADNQWSSKEFENGKVVSELQRRGITNAPPDLVQRRYKLKDIN